MPKPQSASSHARFHPPTHFFVAPVFLVNLGFSIYSTVHYWPRHYPLFLWWIVMSLALIGLLSIARNSALKAQDRIIRLEERLRLATLLPAADIAPTLNLTEPQLIALRFASNAELPTLARRALSENLTQKQIKAAITTWRPDHFRV